MKLNYVSSCGYLVEWGTDIMVLDDPVEIILADNLEDHAERNGVTIDDITILWQGKAQDLPEEYEQHA